MRKHLQPDTQQDMFGSGSVVPPAPRPLMLMPLRVLAPAKRRTQPYTRALPFLSRPKPDASYLRLID